MSGVYTMRPDTYMLLSSVQMQAIEQSYEAECRESEYDPSTITGEQTMSGEGFCCAAAATPSSMDPRKRLNLQRLALQSVSSLSRIEVPPIEPPKEYGAYFGVAYPPSPKEVGHGSTREVLCTHLQPVSFDGIASRCLDSMIKVDNFLRESYSTVAVQDPEVGNLMRVDIHDPHPLAYNNAFWSMRDKRVHCGDVDPRIFSSSLAENPEIIAHEFGHAATFYSANLSYEGESGAINESISDILAITEKHCQAGVKAGDPKASWNICEHMVVGAREGDSLRSMSNPGSGFLVAIRSLETMIK